MPTISSKSNFKYDLNRGFMVYMFSLCFSGSRFLINLQGNLVYIKFFCARKIFGTQLFAGFRVFSFCV